MLRFVFQHSNIFHLSSVRPQVPLGLDFLTFLAATVLVIPTFKSAKISPVLGFLFSGLLLGQLGCAQSACSPDWEALAW